MRNIDELEAEISVKSRRAISYYFQFTRNSEKGEYFFLKAKEKKRNFKKKPCR